MILWGFIMKCENCGKEHDGTYGSGRFCSKSCSCSYNSRSPKHHIGDWICDECGMSFDTRRKMYSHKREVHFSYIEGQRSWNHGLTAETDPRVARNAQAVKDAYTSGRIIPYMKGKSISQEVRDKISESMKLAHKEGRAHNIGESRWNNEPSYPEKWFMEVISNEFEDKNYIREYPFNKYSLDFAWIDKKLCIELDGEQHQRFEEYKERDRSKDAFLEKEGWKVLRMPWKDVYANTKYWIEKAKKFIHE